MADLKSVVRKGVGVRLPPTAPIFMSKESDDIFQDPAVIAEVEISTISEASWVASWGIGGIGWSLYDFDYDEEMDG